METYSVRLAEGIAALLPTTTLSLPGRPDGAPPTPLRLLGFGIKAALRLLLARRAPGVVHLGDMALWPLALPAIARSRRTRIAISAHGTDVSYPLRGGWKGRLYGAYLELGARALPGAVVIANSRATASAAETFGFTRKVVVPLATEVRAVQPTGLHNGEILFVGRLVARKGCAWFIRNVLPLLPEETRLRVVGTVWDPMEGAALAHPRVRFLGKLAFGSLLEEYAKALCVVVPNVDVDSGEFEGFGLVAVEAAAAGGLVLAADHSGLRESVVSGVTGHHLPPGSPKAWAAKIREEIDRPREERLAFLRRSIETARRVYNWDRVAQDTVQAYARARGE